MRCQSLVPAVAALVVLAGPLTPARAGLIEWSYGAFVLPNVVHPNHVPIIQPVPLPIPPRGLSGIYFLPRSADLVNSSNIILANLRSLSLARPSDPDRFQKADFDLVVGIRDRQSGKSGFVTFTGTIDGTLSLVNAKLKFTFPVKEKKLHLGHHIYDIKLTQTTTPGLPLAGLGAIGARVTVHENPEPGSLVLAGMSVPALAWWAWRRRRRPLPSPG